MATQGTGYSAGTATNKLRQKSLRKKLYSMDLVNNTHMQQLTHHPGMTAEPDAEGHRQINYSMSV